MLTLKPTLAPLGAIILLLSLCTNIYSQQLAFPTAKGAGAYTSGGRGGQVIHVTTLDWDASGGLRDALTTPGTRTIVFDVSGEIDATQETEWSVLLQGSQYDNLTIAGQTAPNGGITLKVSWFQFWDVDNIIVRYVRFRNSLTYNNGDGGWFFGCSNVIFDHCTFSHGQDEAFDMATSQGESGNVTIQNCFLQDSKTGVIVGIDTRGESFPGPDLGNYTFINNVFSNISHRFPNIQGNGRTDVINNVAYNFNNRLVRTVQSGNHNVINNYYKPSYGGLRLPEWYGDGVISQLHKMQLQTGDSPLVHTSGNIITGQRETPLTDDSDMWTYFYGSSGEFTINAPVASQYFSNTQFALVGEAFTIKTANETYTNLVVNGDVGAYRTLNADGTINIYRDTNDVNSLDQIINDSFVPRPAYITAGNFSPDRSSIPYAVIPENTRSGNFYISNPHIPEVWFQTNVPAGQDHNDIAPSGYTWLEEYLNQVDYVNSIPEINVTGVEVTPQAGQIQIPETIDLDVIFTPSDATNQTGIWTSSDESIATVDENGIVNPVSEGVVTITFTSNDGGFTDSAVITVLAEALVASAGEDQEICVGQTINLTASGGTYYLWDNGETTASIDVSPNTTTTYTVTVSNDNGESDQASVTVIVNPVPIANAGEDQTICEGETVTLTASGGDTYLWNTGETTANIEVIPSSVTTYTVEVFTGNCSSLDEVTVFVNESPDITSSGDIVIIVGDSTTLGVNGGDNYLWSTGETTPFITVTPNETTTYSVSSTSINGCVTDLNITVTVVPEVIADAGLDTTVCAGETVTLTASGGETYLWSTGDTTSSIEVNPFVTTTYTVAAQDAYGNSDSDSVTVTVNETPDISVSDDVAILLGQTATLIATGGDNYLWSNGESTASIQVSPEVTTTYTVVSTAPGGCVDIEQVTVIIIPEVIADAGDDISICNGESITLTASGGGTYLWDTGETTSSITVNPTITTTYSVTVEDAYGYTDTDSVVVTVNELPIITVTDDFTIVEGNSATLTAEGANTYTWSNGMTGNSITVNPSETTTYIVTGTINGCSSESEVTIIVEDVFVANAGVDEDVCEGYNTNIVLTANNGDSYLWSTGETSQSITVNPVSTTTYSVTITQGIQEDTDEVTVFVNPNPEVVVLNGESVNIMDGDFVTLSASGANTYLWNSGATQPNIAVSPSITTTYEVRGFVGDCYDDKQVTVNVIPEVVADAGEDVEICEGETVQLTASGGDEYVWSTGETSQTIFVSPSETTEYTVTVFNALDFDEDSVIVTVDTDCETEVEDPVIPGETLDFSFDVFPNPASEYVDVKLSGSVELSRVYLYDMTGKLIQYKRISNESLNITSTTRMNISGLQPGFYFIKLEDINRELSKRLIIQ